MLNLFFHNAPAQKESLARSIHEASARSEIGAVDADCIAPGGTDAPLGQANLEDDIRLEERFRERARIAHELHDTLLQGFLGASMLLGRAVEQTPVDSASMPALSRALRLVRQAIDEGRAAIRGLHRVSPAGWSLEQAFSNLLNEMATQQDLQLRIFVCGKPWTLDSAIQEQLFLVGREAVINALRHSQATEIEVEIQYLRDLLRVFVRDNGCGINPEAVQRECDSHWGLRGMRERAEHISARFGIWSRTGAGTEVCVAIPVDVTKRQPMPESVRSLSGALNRKLTMNLNVQGAEKPRVDEGSAATSKNGCDILGYRSQ